METPRKDRQLNLALQAMKNNPALSVRSAAKIYGVPRSTLATRRAGVTPRRDSPPNSAKLDKLEEEAIIER
ncbi:hypothetical protein V500_03909, partial [Pseudogymnoascus sp. VKM F-4518 (FW-2643)]